MRRVFARIGRLIGMTTALCVVLSLSAASTDAGPTRQAGKLVPPAGAYFGTTVDGQEPGPGRGLRTLEHKIGRTFDIVDHYYGWNDVFPTPVEHDMVNHGRIPMISWKGTRLRPIIQGRYDALIHRRARALAAFGHDVFLRWGWEMNGNWEPWSGANNQPNGPAKFRVAWRHIHRIFVRENASNVVFVWAPNSGSTPHARWNHLTNYYPGDAYVDWVGVDGFNWGTTQWWSNWRPLSEVVEAVYGKYAGRKPIMVAETGSVEKGGSKPRWLTQGRKTIERRFPAVAAVIYFNGSEDEGATWKVTSSVLSLRAYRKWGHAPYWNP